MIQDYLINRIPTWTIRHAVINGVLTINNTDQNIHRLLGMYPELFRVVEPDCNMTVILNASHVLVLDAADKTVLEIDDYATNDFDLFCQFSAVC